MADSKMKRQRLGSLYAVTRVKTPSVEQRDQCVLHHQIRTPTKTNKTPINCQLSTRLSR